MLNSKTIVGKLKNGVFTIYLAYSLTLMKNSESEYKVN